MQPFIGSSTTPREGFRVHLVVACEEWKKLLKRYSALVTANSDAVNESLTLSGEEFENARMHELRWNGMNIRKAAIRRSVVAVENG